MLSSKPMFLKLIKSIYVRILLISINNIQKQIKSNTAVNMETQNKICYSEWHMSPKIL